jgi:hypothetical protein
MAEHTTENDESKLETDYAKFTAGEKGHEGQEQEEYERLNVAEWHSKKRTYEEQDLRSSTKLMTEIRADMKMNMNTLKE